MKRLGSIILLTLAGCGDSTPPAPPAPPAADPFASSRPSPLAGPATTAAPLPDAPPDKPAPRPDATPATASFPPDVVVGLRTRILALHPYYLDKCLAADERARVESLLSTGRGTDADVAFLRGVLANPLAGSARAEAERLEQALPDLESKSAAEMPVDRVRLKDGNTVNGRVLEETPEQVKIERRIGGGVSTVTYKREEVHEIARGKGVGAEAAARLARARTAGSAELVAFAAWCREQNLATARLLACHLILRGDPGNEVARAELGLGVFGQAKPAASPSGDPLVTLEGRQWPARELRAKLLKDGYTIVDGLWYARRDRMLAVPGLFKYENQDKKQIPIASEIVGAWESTWRPKQKGAGWVEEESRAFSQMFFAPVLTVTTAESLSQYATKDVLRKRDEGKPPAGKPVECEIVLPIECGGPLIEGRVRVTAEVDSGSLVCFVEADRKREELFRALKKDERTHKLPDSLRGRRSFHLVFKMTVTAQYESRTENREVCALRYGQDRRISQKQVDVVHQRLIPVYPVRLFPSSHNTIEVFRATLVVGDPSLGLNKAFEQAGAMDVLKE